jgi:foldase protein PrsA
MIRSLLRPFAALGSLALGACCLAQVPSSPVITVNGQAISRDSYLRRMEVLPGVGRLAGSEFVPGVPGLLTLQQLVNEALMVQLAEKRGVAVTEAEIDQELAYRKGREAEFEKSYAFLGAELMRYDLKVQIAEFKVLSQGVTVTPFEVESFYEGNKARYYTLPKRFSLSMIAVQSEAAKAEVDKALNGGQPFAEAARKLSADPSRFNDGRRGDFALDELSGRLKELAEVAQSGDVLPWLEQGELFVRVRIDQIKPQQTIPLDATLREDIRRRLLLDRGRVKNNLPQLMREMRAAVQLGFTGTQFDDQLKQLFGPAAGVGIG